ncbi:MAG TPA: metallophosphoesterase family protein [Anaerolineaceae bacterium]
MRILVLSDIHSNLTALQAVVAAAGTVDAVWCLGDLVGYGPDPNEVIELAQTLPNFSCLLGNHDAATLGLIALEAFNREAQISIRWQREQLTTPNRAFLESLPEKLVLGAVTLAHGSPRNPVWEYLLEPFNAGENFASFDTRLCFVGHTHLPQCFFFTDDGRVERRLLNAGETTELHDRAIINPGSTGQPRDHDPRAAYAIFDDRTQTWDQCRVQYDTKAVSQRIMTAGLPARHAARLIEGW